MREKGYEKHTPEHSTLNAGAKADAFEPLPPPITEQELEELSEIIKLPPLSFEDESQEHVTASFEVLFVFSSKNNLFFASQVAEAHTKNNAEGPEEGEVDAAAPALLQRRQQEENNVQYAREALTEIRGKAYSAQRSQTLLENAQFARLHNFLQEISHYRGYV